MLKLCKTLISASALISAASIQAASFRAVSANLDPAAESCLPPNGAIDPGETNTVAFTFQNTTGTDVKSVAVALRSNVNDVAFAVNGKQSAGDVSKDAPFTVVFRFRANGICGGTLSPRFAIEGLESDGTPFSDVDIEAEDSQYFDFQLGATIRRDYTFTAPAPITINDFQSDTDLSLKNGRATPYPSTITASNIPNETGRTGERVSNVSVTLNHMTHTYTADVGALLESPNGQRVLLMRNSGGRVFPIDTGVENLTFTLDGAASQNLPFARQITADSFQPADYGAGDLVSGQAPASPYANSLSVLSGPAPGIDAAQSDIVGTDPNGDWKLYVVDGSPGGSGILSGGWTLTITTSEILCCGEGDTFPTIELGDGFEPTPATGDTPAGPTDPDGLTATATSSVLVIHGKQVPIITWPQPSGITFGTVLSGVQLNASANVSGTFSYTPPAGTVLPLGDGHILKVEFEPLDSEEYESVSASVSINVTRKIPGAGDDFDADGHPDLLFQDQRGFLAAWLLEETTLKSAKFLTPDHVEDLHFRAVFLSDLDADGSSDIVFQAEDGRIAVWFMDGTNRKEAGVFVPDNPGDGWKVAALGDLNSDGKPDIVFQHADGTLAAWMMNGARLQSAALLTPSRPASGWNVAGTGDFNGDTFIDLLFQHANGSLAVWFMNGTALTDAALLDPRAPDNLDWRVVSAADRDQDGKPDLLFQHTMDGTLAVWFMDGIRLNAARLLTPSNPGGTWKVVAP